MKRFLAIIIASLVLLTFATVFASAEDNYDFQIKLTGDIHSLNAGKTFTLKAMVMDITAKDGLTLIQYDIDFDPEVLELVDATAVIPDQWREHLKDGSVENISYFNNEPDGPRYYWIVFSALEGIPVRESDQLGLIMNFKVLREEDTVISFVPDGCTDDNFQELNANTVTVEIHSPKNTQSVSSNVPAEESASLVSDEQNDDPQPSEAENNSSSGGNEVSSDGEGFITINGNYYTGGTGKTAPVEKIPVTKGGLSTGVIIAVAVAAAALCAGAAALIIILRKKK